jgi:hypothetical protein
MLDIEPAARPSAKACLLDPRLNISLRDDQFDLNQSRAGSATPTEILSESVIMRAIRNRDSYDLGSRDSKETETQILNPKLKFTHLPRKSEASRSGRNKRRRLSNPKIIADSVPLNEDSLIPSVLNQDRPGYIQIAVGEKWVSMRKSDRWVNINPVEIS